MSIKYDFSSSSFTPGFHLLDFESFVLLLIIERKTIGQKKNHGEI